MFALNKVLSAAVVGVSLATAASPAFAVSLITGTGDPLTAIPGGNQITFETVATGEYSTLAVQGVTFAPDSGYGGTPAGTGEYVNGSYSGSYNTTGQSLQNTYASDAFNALKITFSTPVSAFAFNWGAADYNWFIDTYNGSTLLGTETLLATFGGNAGTYDGVQDTSADITSAVLYVDTTSGSSGIPDYVFIDNFTFSGSAVAATPLPSTWTMLIAGFIGLGFFAYRGTKTTRSAVNAAV